MTFRFATCLAVAALMLSGCPGDDDPAPDPFPAALQGSWYRCYTENVGQDLFEDRSEVMTVTGTNVRSVTRSHAGSSDGTCPGAGTVTSDDPGTFVLGGEVPAILRNAGTTVTARAADVTLEGQPVMYTILYLDTAANPDVLYTADEDPNDPAHNGDTPQTRHNLINDSDPRVRQ
jgi:hypothetical protein